MVSDEGLELSFVFVPPPQSLGWEFFSEFEDLSPLVGFLRRLRRVCPLREVHHDLRLGVFLPRLVGDAEFVFGAGLGVADWRAEAPPENSNQDVASIDLQDWVDESLRPQGMEAWMGIGFPAVDVEAESAMAGHVAIYFLDDAGNDFALGFDVAGRGDDDTQYADLFRRQRTTPSGDAWGPWGS